MNYVVESLRQLLGAAPHRPGKEEIGRFAREVHLYKKANPYSKADFEIRATEEDPGLAGFLEGVKLDKGSMIVDGGACKKLKGKQWLDYIKGNK